MEVTFKKAVEASAQKHGRVVTATPSDVWVAITSYTSPTYVVGTKKHGHIPSTVNLELEDPTIMEVGEKSIKFRPIGIVQDKLGIPMASVASIGQLNERYAKEFIQYLKVSCKKD